MRNFTLVKDIWHYESPLGSMTMASNGRWLTGLWFDRQEYFAVGLEDEPETRYLPVFDETGRWLDCYFNGGVPDFTPPLSPRGTVFQQAVWDILRTIPYGQTLTYGEIAARIADQRGIQRMSAQAVGGAVGRNPIAIIIPCHRVIGADGGLTGYAAGLDKKRWLLQLEQIIQ